MITRDNEVNCKRGRKITLRDLPAHLVYGDRLHPDVYQLLSRLTPKQNLLKAVLSLKGLLSVDLQSAGQLVIFALSVGLLVKQRDGRIEGVDYRR
jgi:hypothetical protein